MNRFSLVCIGWLALTSTTFAEEPIFVTDAKLKVEAEGGVGGEGPAWHPELGVLTSGNGHINQLDRKGQARIYRKDAGTNGLLFDAKGRPLACEPKLRRVTRNERDGTVTVLIIEGVSLIDLDGAFGHAVDRPNGVLVSAHNMYLFVAEQ